MSSPLTLDALRVLDAIDRRGTFAGAAAELHRVPSAVTYAVAKLEQDLGVVLFDRGGTRPVLTGVGHAVVEEGRELLAAAERLAERARRRETGWESVVRVVLDTSVPPESLHPIIAAFDEVGAGVEIELLSESLAGVWDALVDGRADLAVGAVADVCPPGRFETRPLGHVEHCMVAASGHPLAALGRPASPEDLLAHRLVVLADSSRHLPRRSIGIADPNRRLVVATMRDKRAAIAVGLGIGHLPHEWARPIVGAGDLAVVETIEPPPVVEVLLAWPRGRGGRALRWLADAIESGMTATGGCR